MQRFLLAILATSFAVSSAVAEGDGGTDSDDTAFYEALLDAFYGSDGWAPGEPQEYPRAYVPPDDGHCNGAPDCYEPSDSDEGPPVECDDIDYNCA